MDNKNENVELDNNLRLIHLLNKNSNNINKISRFQKAVEKLNAQYNKLGDLKILFLKDISAVEQ